MNGPDVQYRAAEQRRARILTQMKALGFLSVAELSRDLRVSTMTVRRDLHALESNGDVRVVHGGAGLALDTLPEGAFGGDSLTVTQRRVAEMAIELVDPADTIAVDAGPTALALVRALPASFSGSVITHSVSVIQHFVAG